MKVKVSEVAVSEKYGFGAVSKDSPGARDLPEKKLSEVFGICNNLGIDLIWYQTIQVKTEF